MKKFNSSHLVFASVLALLVSAPAFAANSGTSESGLLERPRVARTRGEMRPHVGIYGGAAGQNGDSYRTDPSFQLDAGYQPIIPFGLAIQAQYEPSSLNVPGNFDFNTTNLVLKETVNFGGTIPVLRESYVGVKNGVAIYSGDVETTSHFAAGPTLGFDIPLSIEQNVSLGAEGTYLAVFGDDLATPDQTSILGAVKYWF